MKKEQNNDVLVLDYEDDEIEQTKPKIIKEDDNIFVFDQDQSIEEDDSQQQKQADVKPISKQQYHTRCSRIQEMIIMKNLTNVTSGQIPEVKKNFFRQAKEKRMSQRINMNKRVSRNLKDIVFQPKPGAILVDFQVERPKSNVFPREKKKEENKADPMQFSMNDELSSVQDKSVETDKAIQRKIGVNGAYSKRTSELRVEESKQKNMLKVSNFRQFLYTQLKPNYSIFILIKKTDSGLINSTYKFYFQDNKKFILSCEKQGFSTYIFSTSEVHITEDHISYLGKLQSSFFGGQFLMFDSGEECSKTKMMENYKKQLSYVTYSKSQNEPRKIKAFITNCDNHSTEFTIVDNENNVLESKWKNGNKKNILKLVSKDPSFDPNDCCFKMDFKGLVGVPSIKNFILQNEEYPDALIFGRKDKQQFLMRVKAPFSIIQAASIAMSSIHHKFL